MSVLIQSYLHRAGLYQFNGVRLVQEMSAEAAATSAEAGLEPEKKKRIKGLLPTGEYKATKFEKLEGPHGEPKYEECENCKKSIRYAVTVFGPDGDHIVGADCAIALTTGETQAAIIDYVTNEKKKLKFLKQSMEKIKEFSDFYGNKQADRYKFYGQDTTVWTLFDDAIQRLGVKTFGDMSRFLGNKGPVKVWSFLDSHGRAQKNVIIDMQYILNSLAYQTLQSKFGEKLLGALEKALESNKTLKNKNFFFEPDYGYVQFIKDFGLNEFLDDENI